MSKEIYISLSSGKNKRMDLPTSRTGRMGGRRILLCSLLILAILSLFSMNPLPFDNGATVAGPGVSNASTSSITMTSTSDTSSVNLTPGGGFKLSESANTAAYDVISNNFSGYTVKIIAADDTGMLINNDDPSYTIGSIATPTLQTDFVISSTTLMNKWGIKPNKYYDGTATVTNTTTLLPSPTTSGTILDVTTEANTTANNYSIAVGAMVDGNTANGTYSKATTISVVPNAASYTLNYDKNTTDTVNDMPDSISGSTTVLNLPVSLTSPTRDHFLFLGWCDTATTLVGNADTCAGNTFQPGDNFGVDQTTENVTTLYAMWQRRTYSCSAEYRLQNADGTYPETYTSIDTVLPNVPYDDTCSYTTTQNSTLYVNQTVSETVSGPTTLQIDVPRTTFELTINKNDSYIGSVSGAGEYRWGEEVTISATPTANSMFSSWSQTDGEASTFASTVSTPSTFIMPASAATIYADGDVVSSVMQNLSSDQCTTESSTVTDIRDGHTYTIRRINGTCWMTQNLTFIGKTDDAAGTMTLDSTTSNVPGNYTVADPLTISYTDFSAGNKYDVAELKTGTANNLPTAWYNYAAASAMTIKTSSNADDGVYDICPAGWHLPVDFSSFTNTADRDAFTPVTGGMYINKAINSANFGYWWSSKAKSATNHDYLLWSGSSLMKGGNYNYWRYAGMSVRCVLDDTPAMQRFSNTDASAMAVGESVTMKDSRDGQKYTVAKLADGNVWMTQNLAIGCNGSNYNAINLTPDTSNVGNSSYTTSTTSIATQNSMDIPYQDCSSTYGAWYNYAAATAGTITGSNNSNDAVYDICPKGWRLPTASEQAGIINYVSTYNPVIGGIYYNNALRNTDYGYWYSSTAYDSTLRYYLGFNSGTTMNTNYTGLGRPNGFYVRCVYNGPTTYMQDFSNTDVGDMATNDTKILTDSRDGQKYTVAKLADGNVWMVDNLNLNASTITASQLDSTNTNLGSGETLSANDFKGWQTSSAANTYTNGQYIPVAGADSTSLSKNGTLYNYCAATAGTVCSSSDMVNAVSDICPKGWRLPTGGVTGEYQRLYNLIQYNTLDKMRTPIAGGGAAFALPGYFNTGTPIPNTAYWTSIAQAATKAYAMSINTTNGVNPANYGERSLGFSIRCIYSGVKTMQEFSNTDVTAMATGETRTLIDSRDNQKYTVAKLSDGNVWMTKNLRFAGESLDYTSSNVPSEYTPSNPYVPNNGAGYINVSTTTNTDYGVAGIYDSGDTSIGVYYNYAAASVGTVTGDSNMDPARYDVCPAGWRLPSHSELSGIRSYVSQFSPVVGGFYSYDSTTRQSPSYGYWTTSTAHEAHTRYFTYYNGSALTDSTTSYRLNRRSSTFVRCIYEKASKTMQEFSDSDINAMRTGDTQKLKDSRDGQIYDVTKLSDGNVWMTRNLAIGCDGFGGEYGTSNVARTLTPADSNVTADYPLPTDTNANGNSYDNAYTTCSSTYGAYYNYAAVSAGTITGSSNTTTATSDICPKGWRMPTNTEQSAILGDVSIFNPSKEGFWYNKSFNNNNAGGWWSSVASNAASRYYLRYESALSVYNPSSGRYLGISVRCMKESTSNLSDISTMQEVTPKIVENTEWLDTATLTDVRDGQEYTVQKIVDLLWMTRNLAIGCDGSGSNYGTQFNQIALDSSNTNITNSATNPWTTPNSDLITHSNATTDYTNPAMACSSTYGAWYNYAAATAGTIVGGSNTDAQTYDICPKGWRLPTRDEATNMSNYIRQFPPSRNLFSPVTGGVYSGNELKVTNNGRWWTATSSSALARYDLNYDGSNYNGDNTNSRFAGVYVRCVAD